MHDDDTPHLLDRLAIWSSCDPCQISRMDLVELVEAAGLTGSAVDEQITATPGQSIVLRQAAVKAMMNIAQARLPARPVPTGKPRLKLSNFPPERLLARR